MRVAAVLAANILISGWSLHASILAAGPESSWTHAKNPIYNVQGYSWRTSRSENHGRALLRRQGPPPPPPPPLPPAFGAPPPTLDDADWDKAVCKGAQMLYYMTDGDSASWTIQGYQSKFLSPANTLLPQYGWTCYDQSPVDLTRDPPVAEALQALGISTSPDEWLYRSWRHDHEYTDAKDNNKKKPATGGRYRALYNKNSRVIVTNHMFAPRRGKNGQPPQALPKLKLWSDITFLQWYYNVLGITDGSGLAVTPYPRLIIVPNIVNQQSVLIFDTAVDRIGETSLGKHNTWEERVEFTSASEHDAFRALLAAPNAKVIQWLLITHKKQFGERVKIEKIALWRPKDKDDPDDILDPFMAIWVGED